jgi:hemerythrin
MFERFVRVKDIMAQGGGWNDMHAALANLTKCVEFCSALEESLMRILHYPECELHAKEHADLLSGLHAMEKANLTSGLTEKMIGQAFAATMKHHLTQDRRYVRSLSQSLAPVQEGGL